jgi:hypothetical protein
MGFSYWVEGLVFVLLFLAIIAGSCAAIVILGSKMINELGNFPTRNVQIQFSYGWKIFLAETIAFILLAGFFHLFN